MNTAAINFYKSVLAAKLSAGLDCGNEIYALQEQLGTPV